MLKHGREAPLTLMMRALVLLSVLLVPPAPQSRVQRCNTACQDAYTECVLACDGNLDCAKSCAERTAACVKRCSEAEPARMSRN
ncbi:MAG: hypothetical protein R3B13_34745 [Polyangiaceae bacterium]